jgi:hypothetical protein
MVKGAYLKVSHGREEIIDSFLLRHTGKSAVRPVVPEHEGGEIWDS